MAVDVLDFVAALPRRDQELLRSRFREIRDDPGRYADYREPDSEGPGSTCMFTLVSRSIFGKMQRIAT